MYQNLPEVLINSNAMENYNAIDKDLLGDICNFLEPFQDAINAPSKDRQPCLHRKLKENLSVSNAPGQGRKRVSIPIDDRNLLRLCKKYRTKSSQILSSELILSNGEKKPLRTPAHKKQRFLFAREHQYWSQEWNNIIWSDEAHFEVLNRKNRTFVRRLRSEADQPFNFVPKVQDGGGSISVWECMASGARGPLVTYSGKVDGRAYVKIIEEALPSFIENAFDSSNKNWMFMRDNAPPHRSKYTMKWLQDKGIKVMEWPVTSPRS
ncbi:unnamed protein product [Rotaria socialis]